MAIAEAILQPLKRGGRLGIKNALVLGTLLLLLGGCDKGFEELNKNPFLPTSTDIGPLFNTVISSMRLGWNEQFYMHNEKLYQVTQQAALTAETFQNINIGTEEVWGNYYTALAHIREIERRFDAYEGDPEALNNVKAQLKIITAYKTFRITDMFGDIPFFEAGRAYEDVAFSRPKFDKQEDIYKFLMSELQWAVENMNLEANPTTPSGEPYAAFGKFDTFFGDFLPRWISFANSLRLRYALRMADRDPDFAFPILKEIIEGNLSVLGSGDDVIMQPEDQDWLNLSVNWSFREHNKLRMGSNIWHLLSEHDSTDGSGIYDPRARFFFENNNAREWIAFPQIPETNTPQSGGIPYQQHRDVSFDFKGDGNIYSPFVYWLIRDEKQVPEVIMTSAEVNFIKAEAYMRGLGVGQNTPLAETEYTSGLAASITFWQDVVVNSDIWEPKPPILSVGEIFQVINHPRLSIFNPDNDKLELIYQQRWMDAFRQPWSAFSLLRRTNATPREGEANTFYRFTYPPSESERNPDNWATQIQEMGGDREDVKIWWMGG